MENRPAFWTHDDKAVDQIGEHLYYFAPSNRTPPPYKTQRHVPAIIDIAEDGTLAGVELIDDMPPPPTNAKPIAHERATEIMALWLVRFRDEDGEPTENDRLMAGHLAGALWANDLLNTAGENWVKVDDETKIGR